MRVLPTPFTLNTPRRKLYLALAACSPLLWGTLAHAGPEGGRVVGGEGLIEQGNGITRIEQLSDLLAIDWDSFDVAADEIVSFLQPGSDSVALNRILGNSGSEILGQITANGQIFLVNPNGVVFGEGARLDVGGVLVSGLDINPDDFMRGDFSFFELEGSAGQVINSGLIEAASGGSVTLLGRRVRNEGVISANLGAVNLAAGREAVLTFDDAGLMGVRVSREVLQEDLGLDPALINNGEIKAAGGRVLLTASASRDVFSGAVNRGDLEPARSVVVHEDGSFTLGGGSDLVNTGSISVSDAEQAGDIVLLGENIDQRGLIDADSGTGRGGDIELHAGHTALLSGDSVNSAQGATLGGDIKVLGHHVGLFDQAKTNASGSLGGGRTFIGGDYQGDNPYLPNAWRTSVSGNAELRADALADGDGGRIIVWSDDITRFHGDIYGRGKGAAKGGFAEVSGKAQLAFSGYADLGGPGGGGTLLLDPEDIYVVSIQEADDDIPPIDFGDGGDGDIRVWAGSIESMLQDNSEQEVRLDARQDIFVNERIDASGGQANSSLVFRAGNQISINAALDLGASSVDFTAGVADCGGAECMGTVGGRNINIANNATITTTGSVDFTAADSITIGASVTAGAINFIAGENITTNASLETTSGSLSLTAGDASLYTGDGDPAGELTIHSYLDTRGGDIVLNAPGAIELRSTASTAGGDFIVGSSDTKPASFASFSDNGGNSWNATIDTSTTYDASEGEEPPSIEGGGAIVIDTDRTGSGSGHVTLGGLAFGYQFNQDGSGSEDPVHEQSGSVDITAGGNVTFSEVIDYNDSGPRDAAGQLRHSDGDVYLKVEADGGIIFNADTGEDNALIFAEWGDARDSLDIDLSAGGGITIDGDIYTSGGNFTASAETLNFNGRIDTRYANPLLDGPSEEQGGAIRYGVAEWSTGGNIELFASSSDNNLGDLVTIVGCLEEAVCTGNVTLGARHEGDSPSFLQVGNLIDVAGTTTLELNEGNAVLTGNENLLEGDLLIKSANHVDMRQNGNIAINVESLDGALSVNTTGQDEFAGGDITIESEGSLTLGEINSGGGSAAGPGSGFGARPGQRAGDITLTANELNLTKNILARGSAGDRGFDPDGAGGFLEISGTVVLGDINSINLTGVGDPSVGPGNFTLNGRIDGSADSSESLTLNAGDVSFNDAMGSQNPLAQLEVNAYGDVSFGGDAFPNVDTLTVNAFGDGRTLSLTDTHNNWTIDSENGGSVALAVDDGQTAPPAITFTNVSALQGGTGNDAFSIGNADWINSLRGGEGGTNSVVYTGDGANNWTMSSLTGGTLNETLSFSDIHELEGKDGALTGTNAENTWILTGTKSGILGGADFYEDTDPRLTFSGMDTLTGGSAKDIFEVEDGAAGFVFIDGGAGTDNQFNLDVADQSVILNTSETNGFDWAIQNFNKVGAENATLALAYGDNVWTIDSEHGGKITHGAGEEQESLFEGQLEFTGFSSLQGGTGDDAFSIDDAGWITDLSGGNGGTNSLAFSGGGANDWVLGSLTEGTLNETLGFSEIHELAGNDEGALSAPNTNNTWTLADGTEGALTSEGVSGSLSFSGMNTLTGGSGNDVFYVEAGASGFALIDGGVGEENYNHFNLSDTDVPATVSLGSIAGSDWRIQNFDEVTGNGENTTLALASGANTWTIDGSASGAVAHTAEQGESSLLEGELIFKGMSGLQGGTGDDTFIATAAEDVYTFAGLIDGGEGGHNSLNLSDLLNDPISVALGLEVDADRWDLINVQNLTGNGTNSLLALAHGTNTWAIDSENAGSINHVAIGDEEPLFSEELSFAGFTYLTGGEGADTFTFVEGTSLDDLKSFAHITGGSGHEDLLDLTAIDADIKVKLLALGAEVQDDVDINVSGIETLRASGSNNSLYGLNQDSSWVMFGENEGHVEPSEGAAPNRRVGFVGFANLYGGTGDDIFNLSDGEVTGSIDGGEGTNWVDYSTYEGDLCIALGGAAADCSPIEFSNVHGVVGNHSNEGNYNSEVRVLNAEPGEEHQWFLGELDSGLVAHIANDGDNDGVYRVDGADQFYFLNMNTLVADAGDDAFILDESAHFVGRIDAGTGHNSIDATDTQQAQHFSLRELTGDDEAGVWLSGFADYVVNPENDNRLTGVSGGSDWEITGENSGTMNGAGFDGFAHLAGGDDGTDTFAISLQGSVLSVTGVSEENTLTLASAPGEHLHWVLSGAGEGEVDSDRLAQFSGISAITSGNGNDHFELNVVSDLLAVNGGGGDNRLSVASGENRWTETGAFSGTVADALEPGEESALLTFSGIQTLEGSGNDTLMAANRNNHWRYGDDQSWTLNGANSNLALSFSGMSTLLGGSQADHFELAGSSLPPVTIAGGSDAGNQLSVASEVNWNLESATAGNLSGVVSFSQIQIFDAQESGGTLTGLNQDTLWLLDGEGSGRFGALEGPEDTWGSLSGDTYTAFSGFDTLQGGSQRDVFYLRTTDDVNFTLSGGGGEVNALYGADRENQWQLGNNNQLNQSVFFSNIQQLVGGSGDDTFTLAAGYTQEDIRGARDSALNTGDNRLVVDSGSNAQANWQVDGADSGSVTDRVDSFSAIAHLEGGTGSDTFEIAEGASLSGSVDGGEGTNHLIARSAENRWVLTSNHNGELNPDADANTSFDSIQTLTGSDSDTLVALDDQNNHWRPGSGGNWVLSQTGEDADTGVTFSGMAHWVGGDGDDHFALNAASDLLSLDGGEGNNRLLVASGENRWTVTSAFGGTVANALEPGEESASLEYAGIQTLSGSDNDTLAAADLKNHWLYNEDQNWTLSFSDPDEGAVALAFSGMSTLQGGTDADHFEMTANELPSVTVVGGSEAGNKLSVSSEVNWNLESATSGNLNATVYFSEIQDFDARNSGSTLTGLNQDTLWWLDGEGRGSFGLLEGAEDSWENLSKDSHTQFSGFESLQGGTHRDVFYLNTAEEVSFTLNGGEGQENALYGADRDNSWELGSSNTLNDNVTFSNIQQLVGGSGDDTFTLSAGYTQKSIRGAREGALTAGDNRLVIGSGGNAQTSWQVDDTDSGSVNGRVTSFSAIAHLEGGAGSDTFEIAEGALLSGSVNGGEGANHLIAQSENNRWVLAPDHNGHIEPDVGGNTSFFSIQTLTGSGTDTLVAIADRNNHWRPGSEGRWSLSQTGADPESGVAFSGMTQWEGGNQDDTFVLEGDRSVRTIEGGGGSNLLSASGASDWTLEAAHDGSLDERTGFSDIQTLIGAGDGDAHRLTGPDANNDWELTGSNSGTLTSDSKETSFEGMTRLQGRGGDDHFEVTDVNLAMQLHGGEGANMVRAAFNRGQWRLDEVNAGSLNGNDFSGIGTLIGVGENHRLVGPNEHIDWSLSDAGAGSLVLRSDDDVSLAFEGFTFLTGGSRNDHFTAEDGLTTHQLAEFAIIDGGRGANRLDLTAMNGPAVDISLGSHDDSHLQVRGFSELVAHEAGNSLRGDPDTAYQWRITGANLGDVSWQSYDDDSHTLDFSNFANLYGGNQSDRFTMLGGSIDGVIDGMGGVNLLDLSGLEKDIVVSLDGNLGDDSGLDESVTINNINGVIGNHDPLDPNSFNSTFRVGENSQSGTDYQWRIESLDDLAEVVSSDGVNDGRYQPGTDDEVAFVNFNRLEGGEGNDVFTFVGEAYITGQIDGQGGANEYNAQQATRAHDVAVARNEPAEAVEGTVVLNVQTLNANRAHDNRLAMLGNEDNTWQVVGNQSGDINGDWEFSGFDHLIGGGGADEFMLSEQGRVARIYGGEPGQGNSLKLDDLSAALTLSLDLESDADLLLSGIDVVTGESGEGHRLQGAAEPNRWVIDGEGSGTLSDSIKFFGFDHLEGNAFNDYFTLEAQGQVIGSLIGGGGDNTLDLSSLAPEQVLTLALSQRDQADLVMIDFSHLIGHAEARHRLHGDGQGNDWVVDGSNRGRLNELAFTGVGTLLGGSGDDHFEFLASGSLSGYLDGGDSETENTLDLSQLTTADVSVGEQGDVRNMDFLKGNNRQTTLRGMGGSNTWRLEDGENTGTLNQDLRFEGVTDLVAGDGGDRFDINGGTVTGTLTGGAGDDSFEFFLNTGAQGRLRLDGAGGDNQLVVTGGGGGYEAEYSASHSRGESLVYTDQNGAVYDLRFTNLSQVEDDTVADRMRLDTTLDPDQITLTHQGYQLDGFVDLRYTNKANLIIAAGSADQLAIAGALDLSGTLEIRNAQVSQASPNYEMRAQQLRLVGVDQFGTEQQPIHTALNYLAGNLGDGGLFLKDDGALVLNGFSSRGPVAIEAVGSLTSDTNISTGSTLSLSSQRGDVLLSGDNQFGGAVSLQAQNNVNLLHNGDLTLADVAARDLTLEVLGDLQGEGPLTLERLHLDAQGDVVLNHSDNRVERLSVAQAESVQLSNAQGLTLGRVQSRNDVTIGAQDLTVEGDINAGNVNLTSRGDLTQDGSITSAGALAITAEGDLMQNAILRSEQDQQLLADGDIVMDARATSTSSGGDILYQAGGNVDVAQIDSIDGRVSLSADEAVRNVLPDSRSSDERNVVAQRLEIEAGSGIGGDSWFYTQVAELFATSDGGVASISNIGDMRVERFANNGNVRLNNRGDVQLDSREGPLFDRTDSDALTAGGTMSANYDIGTLSISITDGNLTALGPLNSERPDLVGRSGQIIVGGDIGSMGRQLIMYFQDELVMRGLRSWRPLWAFGQIPPAYENESAMQMTNQDLQRTGGEQLVEVESLEDIDPAIFTEVRNYAYDDVSILMPPDQRYDDDDEEQYSRF